MPKAMLSAAPEWWELALLLGLMWECCPSPWGLTGAEHWRAPETWLSGPPEAFLDPWLVVWWCSSTFPLPYSFPGSPFVEHHAGVPGELPVPAASINTPAINSERSVPGRHSPASDHRVVGCRAGNSQAVSAPTKETAINILLEGLQFDFQLMNKSDAMVAPWYCSISIPLVLFKSNILIFVPG